MPFASHRDSEASPTMCNLSRAGVSTDKPTGKGGQVLTPARQRQRRPDAQPVLPVTAPTLGTHVWPRQRLEHRRLRPMGASSHESWSSPWDQGEAVTPWPPSAAAPTSFQEAGRVPTAFQAPALRRSGCPDLPCRLAACWGQRASVTAPPLADKEAEAEGHGDPASGDAGSRAGFAPGKLYPRPRHRESSVSLSQQNTLETWKQVGLCRRVGAGMARGASAASVSSHPRS
ncbi:uncharacterized protein LOC134738022 isoform X1 [Pongo pygmaeus]|uniref:uncharacterized protein LOC134738022 isoform X1 n=1 Tax=Pongo pygmaeus TaxID=9600 RepID=UPI00300CAB91